MIQRLRSASIILGVLLATAWLDLYFGVKGFSLALIVVLVAACLRECMHILSAWRERRANHHIPARYRWLAVLGILIPGACLMGLRITESGMLRIVVLVATAKMTDNGALFIGRAWGRRLLAPHISPRKTIAGFWGGMAVGGATALILIPVFMDRSLGFALVFGILVSLFAVLGDLLESRFKRMAEIKDSGTLFPGIGGMLDLLDSVLLAAPVACCLFELS